MIVKQDFSFDRSDGTARLRNTFDIGTAAREAAEARKEGGRRGRDIVCLGYIPQEYWCFDVHLRAAVEASRHKDKYEYIKNVKKFFQHHPEFAIPYKQKVW